MGVVGRMKNLPGTQTTSDVVRALWVVFNTAATIVIPKTQKNKLVHRDFFFSKKA